MPCNVADQTKGTAEDMRLMHCAACADCNAFGALWLTYKPMVTAFLARELAHTQAKYDLDDLVQEVFLRVWRDRSRFRGDASVATWLLQIARTVARRAMARQHPQLYDLEELETLAGKHAIDGNRSDHLTPVEARACDAELRVRIERAISLLPPRSRRALELRHLRGLSYEEAARELGCSLQTFRKSLQRGRQRVREVLADQLDANVR